MLEAAWCLVAGSERSRWKAITMGSTDYVRTRGGGETSPAEPHSPTTPPAPGFELVQRRVLHACQSGRPVGLFDLGGVYRLSPVGPQQQHRSQLSVTRRPRSGNLTPEQLFGWHCLPEIVTQFPGRVFVREVDCSGAYSSSEAAA